MAITTINLTKKRLPNLPYKLIHNKLLKKSESLNVVYIGKTRAITLNKKYRNKDYSPEILTFKISQNTSEIFINLDMAYKCSKKNNMKMRNYIGFLIIHGILHIKGHKHSKKMDEMEDKYSSYFNFI